MSHRLHAPLLFLALVALLVAPAARGVAQSRDFAYLGVQTAPRDPSAAQGGIVITFVSPASSALEMGLQAGDEIVTFNDLIILDQKQLVAELRKENINAKVRFKVRRKGDELRIEGRIGSYQKTMQAYQDHLRKEYGGKPLPKPPATLWWNGAKRGWEVDEKVWDGLQGKLSVVFSFDDCEVCREKRYGILTKTKLALDATPAKDHLAFVGLFYADTAGATGKEANERAAGAFLEKAPPPFPIGVAYYPNEASSPQEREGQFLLHHHGIALLDRKGQIEYLQTYEPPGYDFSRALQGALTKLAEDAGTAEQGVPAGPKGSKPAGEGTK